MHHLVVKRQRTFVVRVDGERQKSKAGDLRQERRNTLKVENDMGERLRVRGNGQRGDGGDGRINLFARFFRIAGERRVVKTGVKFAKIPIHKDSLLIQDRIIIPDFRKRCNPKVSGGDYSARISAAISR